MKKTAVVVNTSRGSAIDTPALTRLLKRRAIRAACLDVFETEPVPKSSPLLQMKNAILTPHIGSATTRTREKMTQVAVDSIIAVLTGKTPVERFVVNKKLLLQ